jgi:hypothetical protein
MAGSSADEVDAAGFVILSVYIEVGKEALEVEPIKSAMYNVCSF